MSQNTFSMDVRKSGRMKYLLLTIFPPLLVMSLIRRLVDSGILPTSKVLSLVYIYLPMTGMMILGYFLILIRNHRITVQDNRIVETNWQGKASCTIKASQIHSLRRNFLGEIILLDADGRKLLCVEKNMSNFAQFEQWLERHNIH